MALVCALVGGATFALFTSNDTNDGNTFGAGTVIVSAGESSFNPPVNYQNMAPGDTINGSFVVENEGSLAIWFKVTAKTDGCLFAGDTPAEVTIHNDNGELPASCEGDADTATINYSVYLPLKADDTYQGAQGELQFKVDAVQKDNNSGKAFSNAELPTE